MPVHKCLLVLGIRCLDDSENLRKSQVITASNIYLWLEAKGQYMEDDLLSMLPFQGFITRIDHNFC